MPANLLLDAALTAAARGWYVFPLIPRGKIPAVKEWEQRATLDPDRIRRCWTSGPYNIGIACGPSRLLVVDQDTPKGPDDLPQAAWDLPGVVDGHDVFALVCERHGQPLPDATHTVRSPSGSTHLYLAQPDGIELRNTSGERGRGLGWKVDTRGGGGLVVAAGSIVAKGTYTTVLDAPVAPLPAWLAERLAPAPQAPQQPVTALLRATDRRTAYLRAAVDGQIAAVTGAPDHHNDALYASAVALGQLVAGGELTESQVTGWLMDAAAQVNHAPARAARTIASGLKAGARRPRSVAA
ncbi:bifunctional DNA primase/polymerase [Streptomyces sp. TLI_171]|uniref:bifunctional DNA primase/polymerase n=1 Tax=Streptomyces sp. TLI_171 TaxID=1938859 RepID=UPI000C1A6424|nr:bifunctional DNA primase/polymerase [Streptomyces sp. TLI_171]RKE19631.1 bifunctional DNA primase/polymerase-like protein [Streptomyces sp. TLI_171]